MLACSDKTAWGHVAAPDTAYFSTTVIYLCKLLMQSKCYNQITAVTYDCNKVSFCDFMLHLALALLKITYLLYYGRILQP
jgi:hypothetical protein